MGKLISKISETYRAKLLKLNTEIVSLESFLASASEKNLLINSIITKISSEENISKKQVLIDYYINIVKLSKVDAESRASSRLVQVSKAKPTSEKNPKKVNSRKGKKGVKMSQEKIYTLCIKYIEKLDTVNFQKLYASMPHMIQAIQDKQKQKVA